MMMRYGLIKGWSISKNEYELFCMEWLSRKLVNLCIMKRRKDGNVSRPIHEYLIKRTQQSNTLGWIMMLYEINKFCKCAIIVHKAYIGIRAWCFFIFFVK